MCSRLLGRAVLYCMPCLLYTSISVEHLAEIFLNLQEQGANNINLVTPGQWRPWIIAALDIARAKGLHLPIVCNTGGYETVESVEAWRGYIDIWLADLK